LETDLFKAITRGLGKAYIDMPFVAKQLPHFANVAAALPAGAGNGRPNDRANQRGGAAPAAPIQQGRGAGANNAGGRGQGGRAPAGDPRDAGRGVDEAAREANKRHGFLVYDPTAAGTNGRSMPPLCNVFVKLRNMPTAERLCVSFCTRGVFCNRGTSCNQVHVSSFASLPVASQEPLRVFVEKTSGLSFAPGQSPPAGTT
jgi:hypothetical protein